MASTKKGKPKGTRQSLREKLLAKPPKSKVTVEGKFFQVESPEGQKARLPISELTGRKQAASLSTGGVVLPDGTKLCYSEGAIDVLVLQVNPGARTLSWITNSSVKRWGGAEYRPVRVALPYLLIMGVFENGVISDWNECFFRTAPLTSEGDSTCFPGFLNCSKFDPPDGRPLAWICTQNLDREPILREPDREKRIRIGIQLLMQCLLGTGFNFSSEDHEGDSWFSQSTRVDARISSIEAWEKATEEEGPLFALDVPWIDTGLTVRQLVDRIFAIHGSRPPAIEDSEGLARYVFNHPQRQNCK